MASKTTGRVSVVYREWFGGWLAARDGKLLRKVNRAIKVFRTEAEAVAAAEGSVRRAEKAGR